jgi:hypothetical protein
VHLNTGGETHGSKGRFQIRKYKSLEAMKDEEYRYWQGRLAPAPACAGAIGVLAALIPAGGRAAPLNQAFLSG